MRRVYSEPAMGTLSGSIHQWQQEVAAGRSHQSFQQQQRSKECWGMLKMAIPLISCALFVVGAILCIDLGLWAAEKQQSIAYDKIPCQVTRSVVNELTCSRQADCSIPNACHHQVYYTCYYPSWELAYKVPSMGIIKSEITDKTSDFGSVAQVKRLLAAHQGTTTCYYNTLAPTMVQWQHPNPYPFFVFMMATASILGALCCCVALHRVCNLEEKMKKARSRKTLSSFRLASTGGYDFAASKSPSDVDQNTSQNNETYALRDGGTGSMYARDVVAAHESLPQPESMRWPASQYGTYASAVYPEQYGDVVMQHAQV